MKPPKGFDFTLPQATLKEPDREPENFVAVEVPEEVPVDPVDSIGHVDDTLDME